jgi:hypothetical protein
MSYLFELRKRYNFNTLASGLLDISLKNVLLVGITDANEVIKFTAGAVVGQYRNIYPLLPNGTPNDIYQCTFYRFKTQDNEIIYLADQWIDADTIEEVTSVSIRITIPNTKLQDKSRIRDLLNASGYTSFTIEELN